MGTAGIYAFPQPRLGEFYSSRRNYNLGITVADVWHGLWSPSVGDVVAGPLLGWTFYPGRLCASVAAEADSGGRLLVSCATDHGLVDHDLVILGSMNSTSHDAPTRVTVLNGSDFTCDDVAYDSGAGASVGTVKIPAYLRAGIDSQGMYCAYFRINATATSSAKLAEFVIAVETTPQMKTLCTRATTGTTGELTSNGHICVNAGERVWVMAANRTNEADIVVHNVNFTVQRIYWCTE